MPASSSSSSIRRRRHPTVSAVSGSSCRTPTPVIEATPAVLTRSPIWTGHQRPLDGASTGRRESVGVSVVQVGDVRVGVHDRGVVVWVCLPANPSACSWSWWPSSWVCAESVTPRVHRSQRGPKPSFDDRFGERGPADRAARAGVLVVAGKGFPSEVTEQRHRGLFHQCVFAVPACGHRHLLHSRAPGKPSAARPAIQARLGRTRGASLVGKPRSWLVVRAVRRLVLTS